MTVYFYEEMENLNYYEILKGLWNNKEHWALMINCKANAIVHYADIMKIHWCDGNSDLHKVLKFLKRIYRHFNDGDALRFINNSMSDDKKLKIVKEKIALIYKVYNELESE